MESAGYSGTPLVRKLGLKAGMRVRLLDAPERYWELMGQSFARARAGMREDGMVWASWPKRSSGVPSEIGRSEVMTAGKEAGLVDIKVCAVDETWSGLKFVLPVADRRT